ncbi:MAG: HAMP domain-containing protein [Leptospiraceae bacterium]|nr:HAMP domain-containing protein [Leptospiraceae bacterium]MCP5493547.1 HAMP domain-containing protein [Leptospiraceae bacterium]
MSYNDKKNRKRIRFPIWVKLLIIISTIILLSLSTIIYITTSLFKNDNIVRIKENNIVLTDILSLKIQSDLFNTIKNLKFIAEDLKEGNGESAKKDVQSEKDILTIGIYKEENKTLKPIFYIFSDEDLNGIRLENIDEIIKNNEINYLKSFSGSTILYNSSPDFRFPVLGISFPYSDINGEKTIVLAHIKLEPLLNAFRHIGIATNFLVDDEGNILAHPDSDEVIRRSSYRDLEIIQSMMKSKIDNGEKRYLNQKDGKYYLGSFKKLNFTGGGVVSTVLEEKAFEEVYNIQRRNIYIMIIVLSAAILIVYIFAKTITQPVLGLVVASSEIEKGNYDINLKVESQDEIGILTQSFNSMSRGLDEREKMKTALSKFTNKEIAEMALKGEIKLGGERKYCAIFFSDIRSFTSISEKLEPEEVVEFLNQYMTEMVKCVNETNGTVDKFIGDAIMATWGAIKQLKENETECAINASLLMRKALMKFNEGRGGYKKPIIKIGCGINSGYVISGQIGSDERLEYTVIGDSVNLASRVESLNKPFGSDILITEESYQRVKNIYKVEKMQTIKVKGKSEPQTIYAVLGRNDDPKCVRSMEELRDLLDIEYTPPSPSKKNSGNEDEKEVKYEILE